MTLQLLLASTMFHNLGNVLIFALFGGVFVWVNLFVIGKLLLRRPHKPKFGEKEETYECGEPTIGDAWIRFDIRFYTLALIFLIFDIEVALLFPWAVAYDEFIAAGFGAGAFFEVLIFLVVLGVGLAYVWLRKDLNWTSTLPGPAVPEEALAGDAVEESKPAQEEVSA
ncbi:MAG: NADH-quinone oxidoreductase subunit A [Planctomycetota bacterium]|nr:NADH-quinone oxidoreductase subunit A [Planctomycetota bacterium]